MSGLNTRRGDLFCTFLLLALCAAWSSCARPATPTAVPLPTPSEREIYIRLTSRYTSYDVIVTIHQMTADDAARIMRALQAIEPPSDLEALHEQAVEAYRNIQAGKLLVPGADGRLRSEAYFMVDWGIALLMDYREHLDAEEY